VRFKLDTSEVHCGEISQVSDVPYSSVYEMRMRRNEQLDTGQRACVWMNVIKRYLLY
jgi:hypothetical protein